MEGGGRYSHQPYLKERFRKTGCSMSSSCVVMLLYGVVMSSTIGLTLANGDAQNLALGRPTFASSVFQQRNSIFHHMRAVDGITRYNTSNFRYPQFYHSATGDKSPWISIDLGTPSVITQVVIWSRCDTQGANFKPSLRIGNFSIQEYMDTNYLTENILVWNWTQNTAVPLCSSVYINFTTTPKVGRWVVLQNPGEHLQVTEIQVFGFRGAFVDSPPNLAFNRPVYISSVFKHYGASVAVDGVTQYPFVVDFRVPQVFLSDTNDTFPWFSVKLDDLAYISRVVIWSRCGPYNYSMNDAELRIGNVSIQYSNDTGRLTSNPLVWTQPSEMQPCVSQVAAFDPPVLGSWVILQKKNYSAGQYLHLAELQVFGIPF
ncbi:hypothetical protein Vafri_19942, partial [Volvox africanus]